MFQHNVTKFNLSWSNMGPVRSTEKFMLFPALYGPYLKTCHSQILLPSVKIVGTLCRNCG